MTYTDACHAVGKPIQEQRANTEAWYDGRARANYPITAAYDYHDSEGVLLYRVVRYTKDGTTKNFGIQRPDSSSKTGWRNGARDITRVPYRLPGLLQAIAHNATVYIVEGEKCVDYLLSRGLTATTNVGGAGSTRLYNDRAYREYFRNADLTIVADNDQNGKGEGHARALATSLGGIARSIRVVRSGQWESAQGQGLDDWLASGGALDDLPLLDVPPSPDEDSPPPSTAWLPIQDTATSPFPSHIFPTAIRDFVEKASEQLEIDTGMVALPVLATISACVQRRYYVRVIGGVLPQYEPLSLYTMGIMGSGDGKTPALIAAKRPILSYMRQYDDRARSDYESAKETTKKGEKAPTEPRPLVLALTDATAEAIAERLADQGERCAVFAGEGAAFLGIHGGGKYSGRPDVSTLNSAWSGEAINIARKTNSRYIRLDRPALAICLMVQPGVLGGVDGTALIRSSGLLARFLYCAPDSRVGHRTFDRYSLDDRTRTDYDRAITDLLEQAYPYPPNETDEATAITMTDIAFKARHEYRLLNERRARPGATDNGVHRDWLLKAADNATRIAGLLALLDGTLVIDESHMQRGIAVTEWAWPHTQRAYGVAAGRDHDRARQAARFLHKHQITVFRPRDIYRRLGINKSEAEEAIHTLLDHRFISDPNDDGKVLWTNDAWLASDGNPSAVSVNQNSASVNQNSASVNENPMSVNQPKKEDIPLEWDNSSTNYRMSSVSTPSGDSSVNGHAHTSLGRDLVDTLDTHRDEVIGMPSSEISRLDTDRNSVDTDRNSVDTHPTSLDSIIAGMFAHGAFEFPNCPYLGPLAEGVDVPTATRALAKDELTVVRVGRRWGVAAAGTPILRGIPNAYGASDIIRAVMALR